MEELKTMYDGDFARVSGDVWKVLSDKAENEAYDKINMVHKEDGVTAYGVLYGSLTCRAWAWRTKLGG